MATTPSQPSRPIKKARTNQHVDTITILLGFMAGAILMTFWQWKTHSVLWQSYPQDINLPCDKQATVPLSNTTWQPPLRQHPHIQYYPNYTQIRQQIDAGNDTAGAHFLDFAIIGFPKCGTSTMMYWLGQHEQVQSFTMEIRSLQHNHPAHLVKRIQTKLLPGPYFRGYKCPNDVENARARNKLAQHFPQTSLIVGLRHPVWWMQSFYNYRIQNGMDLPPLLNLSRICIGGQYGVCTQRSAFQYHLAKMGLTPLYQTKLPQNTVFPINLPEWKLFDKSQQKDLYKDIQENHSQSIPNPVFLYLLEQIDDNHTDTPLGQSFRKSLQDFLGLTQPLPLPHHTSPGKKHTPQDQDKRNAQKIQICESQYRNVRRDLTRNGRNLAKWIGNFFLQSPKVVIANPKQFHEILATYGQDPC